MVYEIRTSTVVSTVTTAILAVSAMVLVPTNSAFAQPTVNETSAEAVLERITQCLDWTDARPMRKLLIELEPESLQQSAEMRSADLMSAMEASEERMVMAMPIEDRAWSEGLSVRMMTLESTADMDATSQLASLERLAHSSSNVIWETTGRLGAGNTEEFSNSEEGSVKEVAEDPVSTFSIDVDTASYSIVRSSLMGCQMPPPEAVRVEEMINYFPYAHPAPEADLPFRPTVSVFPTPWNDGTKLLHIAIQGALPEVEDRPPLNLVFLIDTSGSMSSDNKLPLVIRSLRLLLEELRPEDEVAIVTYAGSAGLVLEPTPAGDRGPILAALDRLHAGGSTAGQAGLRQAYSTAREMAGDGEVTRVILATDGDFNVGLSDPKRLERFIERQAASGTYLSVLGFGRGNLDDATMQALAQHGNGTAAYIDSLGEARKVLVDQLSGALFPIADDVKIQVEFNPARVAEYRLIGYETRALRRQDFNNDAVDAGEIGAGHSVAAIYEITPVGSPAQLHEPLRYRAEEVADGTSGEFGFLRLRYKDPGAADSQLIERPITTGDQVISSEAGFAAAIAGFGQLLRGTDYLGDWSWEEAIALADANRSDDPFGYRAEAVALIKLAQSLDGPH